MIAFALHAALVIIGAPLIVGGVVLMCRELDRIDQRNQRRP